MECNPIYVTEIVAQLGENQWRYSLRWPSDTGLGDTAVFVHNPTANSNDRDINVFHGGGTDTFGIEGLVSGAMVDITLTLVAKGQVVYKSAVRVKVAPFILADNTQPVSRQQGQPTVFVAANNDTAPLVNALGDLYGQNLLADQFTGVNPLGGPDIWQQDPYSIGYASAPYGQMTQVLALPRDQDFGGVSKQFIQGTLLSKDVGVNLAVWDAKQWSRLDDGGDIMSLPRPGQPGYFLHDDKMTGMTKQYLIAQGVNPDLGPSGGSGIDMSWTRVGHVDEVISPASDGIHTLLASPELAWGLLLYAQKFNAAATIQRGLNGLPPAGVSVNSVLNSSLERLINFDQQVGASGHMQNVLDVVGPAITERCIKKFK